MEYNPYLARLCSLEETHAPRKMLPEDQSLNIPHQTRWCEPSAHEKALANALETLLVEGIDNPEALAEGLNRLGVLTVDGVLWSGITLQQQIHFYNTPPQKEPNYEFHSK